MTQTWYGGYKANIAAYALAKLVHMVSAIDKQLNLVQILKGKKFRLHLDYNYWQSQSKINGQIKNTPENITNVTEWCKKEFCWQLIQEMRIPLMQELMIELVDTDMIEDIEKNAVKTQRVDNGIFDQKYILEKGAEYWKKVAQYGLTMSLLSPKEMSILGIACEIPMKLPSEKQSKVMMEIEKKVIKGGFYSIRSTDIPMLTNVNVKLSFE